MDVALEVRVLGPKSPSTIRILGPTNPSATLLRVDAATELVDFRFFSGLEGFALLLRCSLVTRGKLLKFADGVIRTTG